MPSPEGEGGPAGPDEGQVFCSCPQTGGYGRLAPHQPVVGATDSFPQRGSPACRKRCAHPLAPSARGLRPQAVGERTVRLPEIFRAMARFSPSAPSGHLPRRGRFFDTLSFPQRGSQYNKKPPLPGKRSGGFALAYTRPTYLLYHFYYVLFNPDYAQILHIKVVRSANRRNLRAVV